MQIYEFMKHFRFSCLYFQFIFLSKAKKNKLNNEKTIIFVNSMNDIQHEITIFYAWMRKLSYSKDCI